MKKNKKAGLRILFIGKANDHFSKLAGEFLSTHFKNSELIYSNRNEPFPIKLNDWEGDLIISYLSQWIIPEELINHAALAAINFHPGPPEYPGIGCTNFAIYNKASEFGITCHHMVKNVDSGPIINVRRFPVYTDDSVYSITQRCYNEILTSFFYIIDKVMDGDNLPVSSEVWKRKPYLRKELNALCKLESDMPVAEIEQRIKATTYLHPWAYFILNDKKIVLTSEDVENKSYLKYLNNAD